MLDDGNTRESDVDIKINIKSKRRSRAWKYFRDNGKGDHMATCTICGSQLSYYSSVTNLNKHIKRKHQLVSLVPTDSVNDDQAEGSLSGAEDHKESEAETKPLTLPDRKNHKKESKVWKYFTKVDEVKHIAKCKICSKILSYVSSVSNLMKHAVKQHDLNEYKPDCSSSDEDVLQGMGSTDDEDNQKEKSRPMVWLYFKCLDPVLKISMCLICMKRLSSTSVSNLKKHLMNKHPHVKLPEEQDDVEKQILVAEDGQIYEIETNDNEEHKLSESTPMDTVYLEDYTDDEPERTKYEPERTKYEPKRTIFKPRIKNKQSRLIKRVKKNNVLHEMNSSDEELPLKYKGRKEDSLDHFAKYATSLLRQLPKNISDQLQLDFIREILNAKIHNETVTDVTSNSYSITVTNLVTEDNNEIPINKGSNNDLNIEIPNDGVEN